VPKPLQRVLKVAALVLCIGALVAAFIAGEIPLNMMLAGMVLAGLVYWVTEPIPKRNQG
jgi:hypothetical protein